MRFSKRPKSDHEIVLAMGTTVCICECSCTFVCSCPPIPTHQIQPNQTSQGLGSATLQSNTAGSAATYQEN